MATHIIYGSDGGMTRSVAKKIAKKIDAEVFDIKTATVAHFEDCDLLILGAPTYDVGELQDDWKSGINTLKSANLNGKKVALFGLGDQMTYPDSFADAVGILYDALDGKNAELVGKTSTDGYEFSESRAVHDGSFVGLIIDQDSQSGQTAKRIEAWTSQLA